MEGIIAALPDGIVTLLGGVIAVVTGAVAGYSLSAIARRRRAEQHFREMLRRRLADERYLLEDFLAQREREELFPESEYYYEQALLNEYIYKTLDGLEPKEKRLIWKALNQPSAQGRRNYLRKVLTETAHALRESEHGAQA